MITMSWSVVMILAPLVCGEHGRGASGPDETAAVREQIVRMQTCPNGRARDNAAHALRKFDWRCHPEAVEALAYTLLHDREEEVREEAAQSLTKMRPCLAVVHMALAQAANADPDHATRRWARKGLRAMGGRCEGACKVCGPEIVGPITPAPMPSGGEVVISGPTIVPGDVPIPVPNLAEPVNPPGTVTVPVVPPSSPPPIDSRVEPPPTELSPLPPPSDGPAPSASPDPDNGPKPEKTTARESTLARGRTRRLPFGLRLPSILSRR